MWNDFKAFVMRGNVLDLAVGVIIGGAFGKIVSSLVNDVLMPLIGLLLGGVNFSEQAVAVGAAVVKWGAFVQSIIDFLIIAAVIFWIVRTANAMQKPALAPAPAAPTTKECPYCRSAIHLKATRCPNCTSELRAA
ncbi:MAG TPA: large conductance mechanosensitive channel protein MscL [Anaerolineales bacterium]|nr:large conductance mechanosensitive channel protein MscL [Anaerolineales bacterium]